MHWRKPNPTVDAAGNPTGWVQVNIQLTTTKIHDKNGNEVEIRGEDLAEKVRMAAELLGVTMATYTYTALWYLAVYKYPPPKSEAELKSRT